MDHEAELDPRYVLSLDAGQAIPEAIAEKLRGLIDDGELKPGGRLPNESDLARRMNVARSSVRAGLQRLESIGVVEVRRGLGWFVRRSQPAPTAPSVIAGTGAFATSDLFELRIGLEGLATSLAAVRALPGEIDDIDKYNQRHLEAGDDPDELLRTDQLFHEAIVKASRNELLIETYLPIVAQLADWRYESYSERGVPLRSAREHSKVVRYLRNGDPGGARAAMSAHLQRLYDSLPEIRDTPLDLTETGPDHEVEWLQSPT